MASSYSSRINAIKKRSEELNNNSSSQKSTSSSNNSGQKQSPSTNTAAPATNLNSSKTFGNSSYISRIGSLKKRSEEIANTNATRTIATPESFHSLGGKYIKNADGSYSKATPFKSTSDKDRKSVAETGHETLFTDLGQALKGGTESWKAGHLGTLSTIDLVASGIKNRDNNYQPPVGSALWKQLQASSASNRYASELTEDSKAGRGKVGQIVMDVGSQAVMNGIDAAIRSIPFVGQALGTASFMSRSFGGTAQQKRDEGKSIATQVLSGAVSAGIEQFTENMSRISGIRSYTGADVGLLDNAYNLLESSIAKKLGPVVAKMSTSMLSEGVEEIMSDILTPLVTGALEGVTKDTKLLGDFEAEEWQSIGDIAYDGLIGALSAVGGGMVESLKASATYNSEDVHRDNKLYAAAIREEFQQEKAKAKAHDSLFREMDSAFTREHKRTLQQWASEQTGRLVSKKDALHMAVEAGMMEDIYHRTAKQFSKDSFAKEVVPESVLEKAIYNYLTKGEFADELNVTDDVKKQITDLSNEVMIAYCQEQIDEAQKSKGKKAQARLAMLQASLGKLMRRNQANVAAEEVNNANVDDITEARTYGYTAEELAADQAAREAELHPEQERPAYVARQEQAQQTQQAQQQEGWVMRGDTNIYDPRNQAYIQKNNPELWAEYQNAKGMSGDAGVAAMRDATAKMKTYLAEVNRESNVSWQTTFSPTSESGIIEENAIGETGETYGKQTVQNSEEASRTRNHREWFDSKNRINAEQGQKIDAFVSGGAEEAVSGTLRVRTRNIARGKAKDVIFNKATVDNATEIISALQSSDGFNGHTFYNSESKEYTGHILSSEELTDEEKSLVKLATLATNSMIFVYDGELSNNDVAFTRYTPYGSPIIVARMTDLAHEGVHSVIKELMWAETSSVYGQLANKAKGSIDNADFESIWNAAVDFVQERYADELKRIAIYSYNSEALYDSTMDYIKEVYGFSGDDSKTIYRSNEELIAHLFNEEDYAFATPGEVNRLINVFIKSKNETLENFALNIIPVLEKYSGYSFSEEEIDSDEAFGISNISDAEIDRLLLGDTLANTQRSRIKQLYEKVGLVYDERSKKEERHKLNNERKFETKIDSFRDDNFFLSNMYRTPVTIDGITYPSAENAFQALKCANKEDRQKFVNISPFEAKKLGKTVKAVENWEYKRIEAMRNVLRAKFSNQRLYNMLKKTSGSELVEGNDWGDNFWGVSDKNNKKLKGQNYLGKLLMDIRDGTKTVRSITELTKRAISGDLSDITDDQLQYVFNYTLKRAGIKRSSSEILNDITDFVLGNFEKDFVGRDNFRTGQYKDGFSGVDAGYSFGNTESSRSYLRMPLDNGNVSRRSLEVTTDAYTRDEEPSGFSVSNQALALLHLVDEIDRRPNPVINHWVDSYNNQSESSVIETPIDIKDEDFERGGKFSGLDKDYVKSIAESLRDGYDEGFLTEQATDLRSSLMSGFAPSAEYSIGDLTVDQRLNLLKLAYPGQDYSVSSFNPNEIVEGRKSTELKEYERGEREWNKRHLQNGAEADDNKTAFGYLRADPTPIQIGTDKKGNPIMGSGWVDTGKANQENVSVEDKRSALEKIAKGKEAEGKIKSVKKRLADIDRARNGLKAVLEARKNRLVDYTSEQLDAANKAQEYLYDMLEDADDLGRYGWASSSEDGQARLAKVNYEKGVLKLTLQSIQNTDPSRLYDDDLNRYIVSHLESLVDEAKSLYQEIDRQQKLVREASYRGTQRNAVKNNWIDVMSSKELRDLFRDENGSSYYDNLMLTSYEKEYINERLERENQKDNRPLGSDDLPVQTKKSNDMSPEDIKLAKQYNLRNKTESLLKSGDNIQTSNESESAGEIQNAKGTFRADMPYAVTSDAKGSVDANDISNKINVGESSKITTGDYVIYVAYSKGTQDRFDSALNTEPTYTAEVYDGNKLVCITSLSTKQWGHDGAINGLSDRISRAIGAYENGSLKAVVPESNGIGTKAQWRNELNRLIGWKSKGDYNTFKSNGQQSETFTVGNYSVEISSDISENAEPKRGDKYHYKLFDKDGDIVARGTWPMTSAYSPAWLISEDVFDDAVKFGERVGYVARNRGNRVSSTGNTATAETVQARSEANRRMQEREERNQDYAERESAAMSDEEFWQSRRADLDMPTLEEFTRGQNEQPTVEKKMSPAAANEIAERSFGKKGRVRATRVVENFPTNFKMSAKVLTDAQAELLNNDLGKMRKALIDVNDGYGTVKNVSDIYKTWRDNKLLADYYDEDIAARFDKILEDAEAKGWTFEAQDQREFAQAYEEACNAMTAKINNVNKSADRLSRLKTEAIANKLNIKSDGLISKTIQRFIRMQITTDTAMKLFGGFKGSGEFYQLGKDIKDGVAKRMIKYVDAYSHFDNLKKMEGFKEFSQNAKKYQLKFNNEFNEQGTELDNPFKGVDLSLQQIVTISRLIKTLDKTFEHSDAKAADRVKGFVIRDSNGNSKTIDLGLGDTTDTGEAVKASGKMTAIKLACDRILNQDGAVFEVARAYDKACDAMFKSMGKDVSAVKKALTGNALSLIGEDYTPVLWANDDGSPAEFNFNDDDRLRPPAFLYNRTAKQGNLVVSDISYIVDKYIEKAADYIGTAEIKDTLSRLNDGTSLLDKGKGLNSSLAENFGKDAGTWFDEYVKDLTQYGENDSIWSALRKNMQKGALIGSPSVMMKQTSSYWSAMGLLSPEALAMAYRWKVGVKAADNSEYNKLLKYRHISDNIDPTLTEIIKGVDKYGKASNSRVFQLFTNGISEQDFKTVDNLYTATMIDTYLKNQNKGAEYFASGEFQNDIDSKFTEVMMRSQPMFDTELRAEYARTDNELVKMTSMFRTQQTQNLNLIATAIGEYNASKGTGEQGEKLKVLQQTVAGQASAALSLALLSVAADFMLHGLKKYRGDGDDDDEEPGDGKIELGRILGRIGLNTVETGAGTIWFGDSVAKWLIDRMSGGETSEFYGLNMGPITTFKNVLDNLEYVAKSPTPSNIKNVATNISQLMGIPLNNAYRIVNSAVMYVEDVAGVNDKNYDDMLKKVTNRTKVNEKNVTGRNLLVESGMTKREATAFVKTVDVDDNGLNKEDLQNYYIEHPEDAERVSILWDSMGWKTKFEKEQKSLDKKVVYNSNPLYAEMDEDESGSVTKTEMMDYALEHEDQIDELSALYKEQGFKGSFRSALKSAENSKLKEQAEDAFYEGDYNVLFDTVSQMKNGKTYLTNLIKDEYDEYDNVSNPLVRYMIDAKRPVKEIDEAVEAYGAKKFIPQYKALRSAGLAPKAAIQKLDNFDANANGSITQQELADYYKAHKDEEAMIAEFWKACGWSTTWSKYKKRKKLK